MLIFTAVFAVTLALLRAVILLRSLTQAMQCGVKKGYRCSWPRADNHTSCCQKCRMSRGKKHSGYCISRMPDAERNRKRTRAQAICDPLRPRIAGTVDPLSEDTRERADAETLGMQPEPYYISERQDAESNRSGDRVEVDSGESRGLANAEESSAGKCIVCFESATHALIPCGHMCLCDDCAPIMVGQGTCPICRGSVQKSIHIYQS